MVNKMNNFEKHLLIHIVQAKLEPTKLQDISQKDVSQTDWQQNTDVEEQVPIDYSWIPQILLSLVPSLIITATIVLVKYLINKAKSDPSDLCAKKALEILAKNIQKIKSVKSEDQGIALLEIFKDLIGKLDEDCRAKFLDLPDTKKVLKTLSDNLGLTIDELEQMLKNTTKDGLIAIAALYLKAGSQNAAIRVWAMANGANENLVRWLVGLGAASIITIGAALAIGSGALDLTGIGASIGVPAGVIAAMIIALGVWLKENQPADNNQNNA